MAKTFTKHVTASAAVSASPAPQSAKIIFAPGEDNSAERNMVCKVSHSLTNPLNGGSAAMENVPARKASAVQRHPFDQATELIHVARASFNFHRPHAEKQQRFVKEWLMRSIQSRNERNRRQRRMIRRDKNHSRAKTGDDDADVFDGTVRQHGFEIIVGRCVKNSQ